jgi:isoleucyl-tRNA synthetase
VVDEHGKKMSKSLGNFVSVGDALKELGGDIVRLWTSSMEYRNEMHASSEIILKMSDSYRRIRNTFRYILGNLSGFDPEKDSVEYSQMPEIDRWALHKTDELIASVTSAYESFQFHRVYHNVLNFCVVEMSSFYFDIMKDRLYTFSKSSLERRATQTVLHRINSVLVRLLAPVLVYTSEEVWNEINQDESSVHLSEWPTINEQYTDKALNDKWESIIKAKTDVARELETMRAAKQIGSSLEAAVVLYTEDADLLGLLKEYENDLAMIFIVSDVTISSEPFDSANNGEIFEKLSIKASVADSNKCDRCWNYRKEVGEIEKYPTLCNRCAEVIEEVQSQT